VRRAGAAAAGASVAVASGGGAGGGGTACTTGDCGAKLIAGDAVGAGAGATASGAGAGAGAGVRMGGVTGCVFCAAAGIAAPARSRLKATRRAM
jgi:hypothetical protein